MKETEGKGTKRRKVDLVVISDIHLGTYGCKAPELLNYLRSIKPKTLILNGDIIDIWQFSKRYFPKSHLKIMKYITTLLTRGTTVHYITGNHDELLRKFSGVELGGLTISNKLLLELDGKKVWFFHGDVFDVTMKHSKWIARLGGKGYDLLIILNLLVNKISNFLGQGRISLSKKVKDSVKSAVKFVNNYERTAAEVALRNGYDYVVCGHIHQPKMQLVKDKKGRKITYLNSGDWVENLSALEYHQGRWSIFHYYEDQQGKQCDLFERMVDPSLVDIEETNQMIFSRMVEEFRILPDQKRPSKGKAS
jgi:UDP-2,3-diacylglucosamine pyrophosphatase LpxH